MHSCVTEGGSSIIPSTAHSTNTHKHTLAAQSHSCSDTYTHARIPVKNLLLRETHTHTVSSHTVHFLIATHLPTLARTHTHFLVLEFLLQIIASNNNINTYSLKMLTMSKWNGIGPCKALAPCPSFVIKR